MQCSCHFFLFLAYFYFSGVYSEGRHAKLLSLTKCPESEGKNKYDFEMTVKDDRTVSFTADLTEDITNDHLVHLNFKKKAGDGAYLPLTTVNFDNIKEPLDHVKDAWEKARKSVQPPIKEPYLIPKASYKLQDFFIDRNEIKLPIDQPGEYMVILKLFSAEEEEVGCFNIHAVIE